MGLLQAFNRDLRTHGQAISKTVGLRIWLHGLGTPPVNSADLNLSLADHFIPEEILAAIFLPLPARDRVRVCAVCRRWRQCALRHPSVWTDIDLGEIGGKPLTKVAFLLTSLSRSKSCVVRFDCGGSFRSADRLSRVVASAAISANLGRMSWISWSSPTGVEGWVGPAPVLTHLSLGHYDGALSASLFGGLTSRLHLLEVHRQLPPFPISSVKVLVAHGLRSDRYSADIYKLFPGLTSLSLTDLPAHTFRIPAPLGPCPIGLRETHFATTQMDCDIVYYFRHWTLGVILMNSSFTLPLGTVHGGVFEFISGAQELSVLDAPGGGVSGHFVYSVVARMPGDRIVTVTFTDTMVWDSNRISEALARDLLSGSDGSFDNLSSLSARMGVVQKIWQTKVPMPHLRSVYIHLDVPGPEIGWLYALCNLCRYERLHQVYLVLKIPRCTYAVDITRVISTVLFYLDRYCSSPVEVTITTGHRVGGQLKEPSIVELIRQLAEKGVAIHFV